jgi:hypothetical protein
MEKIYPLGKRHFLNYLTDAVPRSDASKLARIRIELIDGVKEKIGAGKTPAPAENAANTPRAG